MQYMAPEQWVCARDVDARADLWAVGVVLFELLTGKSPFTAKSVGVLIEQVFGGSAPRLRELAPTAPAELEALVARCMQRHPSARFESARELADEIEGLLGSLQEAASYAVSAPQADRAGSTPATDTRAHGDETLAVADTEIASARAPERTPTRAPAGGWTAYFGLEASRRRRRDDDATIEAAAQSVRAGARRVWSKAARFALDSPVGGCSSSAAFAM
jgi:serine/threonine-protein kinase